MELNETMAKKKIVVSFDIETKRKIKELSEEKNVSQSGIVASITQLYFNENLDFESLLENCNPPRTDLELNPARTRNR